jgi:hypothetical protein
MVSLELTHGRLLVNIIGYMAETAPRLAQCPTRSMRRIYGPRMYWRRNSSHAPSF